MIKQAEQSLGCLKCLLDIKQLICSCFFCSQAFFEISKSIRTDSCFLNFLKTPYLSRCEKPNLAGCALAMLPGHQPFWGISPTPHPPGPPPGLWGTRAQDGFVTWQCLALKGRAEWKELVGISCPSPFAFLDVWHSCFLSPQNGKCTFLHAQHGTLRKYFGGLEPSPGASYTSTFWAASPVNNHFLWIFINLVFISGLYLKMEGKTCKSSSLSACFDNCHPLLYFLSSD